MTRRVMVVDDEPAILDVLRLILEDEGYEVLTATRQDEIRADQSRPELILLDIWLSGVSGEQICRQLKGDPATRDIPVILVSANRDTAAIAKHCGAEGFISKPFDLDEVLDLVGDYLGGDGSPCPSGPDDQTLAADPAIAATDGAVSPGGRSRE